MLTEITGMRNFTPTINVRCEDVAIGERARKDLGDLKPLKESINRIGLLNPITITEENHQLVAGLRRLEACKSLGHERIAARVISIDHICRGEYDENEVRKDFTPSERESLASAIHEILKSRGRRTDRGNPFYTKEQQQVATEVAAQHGAEQTSPEQPPKSRKSRETASQMAGLKSWKTCHRIRCVKKHGIRPLVDAMDSEEISIDAAFLLSHLQAPEQADVLEAGPDKIKETVRRIRSEQQEASQRKTVEQSGVMSLQYLLDHDKISLEEAHRIAKKDPAEQEDVVAAMSRQRGGDIPTPPAEPSKRRKKQKASCGICWGIESNATGKAPLTLPDGAPPEVSWFAVGVDTTEEGWQDRALAMLEYLMRTR